MITQKYNYETLVNFHTFEDRLQFLIECVRKSPIDSMDNRFIKQKLYVSKDWCFIREKIIIRDLGKDLGIGDEIGGIILIHHIIPITTSDIYYRNEKVIDPNNLICTSKYTHDCIHLNREFIKTTQRKKNDTCPWKGE